jgi:hypothetical protein
VIHRPRPAADIRVALHASAGAAIQIAETTMANPTANDSNKTSGPDPAAPAGAGEAGGQSPEEQLATLRAEAAD